MESLTDRASGTLRTLFLALPDLMKQIDADFLTRFGTNTLNDADKEALANVQQAADSMQAELIEKAVARHEAAGIDPRTARRLAVAEFGTLFICALDFAVKGAVNG
ncbi:MAG: hypothetical protein AAGU26_04740 [bacterium]